MALDSAAKKPTGSYLVLGLDMGSRVTDQVIEILSDRIGSRATIQQQGNYRILVQAKDRNELEAIRHLFDVYPPVTFHLVDTKRSVQDALRGRIPTGDELLWETDGAGMKTQAYLVQRKVIVSGDRLRAVNATFNTSGDRPVVDFVFDQRGAAQFEAATRANVGGQFAIVERDRVLAAPVIREPIIGGSGQISTDSVEAANTLAKLMLAGNLPSAFTVLEYHVEN